jgi:hypothetical protein
VVSVKMQPGDQANSYCDSGKERGWLLSHWIATMQLNLEELFFAFRDLVETDKDRLRCEVTPDMLVW